MLIKELKDEPNYFMEKYNKEVKPGKKGVYIPPHRLQQYQKELENRDDFRKNQEEQQRKEWELLRKSITGIINKINSANIEYIVMELLNENIIRGKGILARAIIKAQMASIQFSNLYSALVAVLNMKLPEIGDLIVRRVILQFRRSYQKSDRLACNACIRFFAHLINQRVINELLGLQLVVFFLEEITDDSIQLACLFLQEAGKKMTIICPNGIYAIFERLKKILHEGETSRKLQYSIEKLFNIRKNNWAEYPDVIPELDLVEEDSQIIHNIDLDDNQIKGDTHFNIFMFDEEYEKKEQEWDEIKHEILGEETIIGLKQPHKYIENDEEEDEDKDIQDGQLSYIKDMTKDELLKLKEKIYLTITNSIDFEECAHKLLKMALPEPQLEELCNMIVDCCSQERTFNRFYGYLAQRFCDIDEKFKLLFYKIFHERYTNIFNFEAKRLRNIAKIFAHILYTNSLEWNALQCIVLTEEETTASSRIFIKVII